MSYWLVLYLTWACPGGWLGQKAIAEPLRPFVCAPTPSFALLDRQGAAEAMIRRLGPIAAPQLHACRGFRCKQVSVEWRTTLELGR